MTSKHPQETHRFEKFSLPLGMFFFLFVSSFTMLSFLCLPVLSLFFSIDVENVRMALQSPHVVSAFQISLYTTTISAGLIVLFGTPLAYAMARYTFPGKNLVNIIIDLPMVVPPSVAGIGLLMAFGRRGIIGEPLYQWGISISFTPLAVILAQMFIAAPFYIRAARAGFGTTHQEMEAMARSLGANWFQTFSRVSLPLAQPYLISGLLTSWARALGEFGATIMFAGSFIGKTETMPLAIYSAMQSDMQVAIVLAALLLTISITLMFCVRLITLRKDLV